MEYQLIKPLLPDKNLTVVERVLSNRGIMPENIQHYLNTTDDDIIDPTMLMNVEVGAKMLIRHISQGDDVLIQIDSDCDGYTSSAALINYLYSLFPGFVKNHVFYRIHTGKQHGIIPQTVPDNIKLVIAPDSSSNDYDEHKELHEKGIDVLVIDHHEADAISEHACIINNQLCDYPTKSLSGVGVVYKFCSYIDSLMGVSNADLILDLVAVGMVADMMDLRDYETRHLVTKGLDNIRNPYLKGMVQTQNFSISKHGGLDPFAVSFYIAPQVNATIRVGTQEEKLMLFESMLDYRGYEQVPSTKRGCKGQTETRVEQACRNCLNIKNRQTKARDTSLNTIEQIIEKNNLLDHKFLVVKLEPDYATDRNLTGLIANQLMAKYQRPVLLLNRVTNPETKAVSWEGSGRGYDKSKFDNLREYLKTTDLVMYAEGHANALGVGVEDSHFSELVDRADTDLKDYDFTPCYKVDEIFHSSDFNGNDIVEVAELKSIWGQGVEEPMIAIEGINVTKANVTLMSPDKSPTLKITLPNGTSLIKFRSSSEEYENLCSELGCVTINVVGKCERNVWNGSITPQIIIEDYEIVGSTQYYF
jgi:single-stranded-DNA-specific exonuclease